MNIVVQPEGNYYDKYSSTNPIERFLMNSFFNSVSKLLPDASVISSVLEAGCGEGHFTHFLRKTYPDASIDAFDVGESALSKAIFSYSEDAVNFNIGDIYNIDSYDSAYSLTVASEVLEHLEHPESALCELLRTSSKYVLVTVPLEPLWRILNICRGKYLKDFGNTPGHICHWSMRRFRKMIISSAGRKISLKMTCSLPWILVLIKKEDILEKGN